MWGHGAFEDQLEEAYGAFREWCRVEGKVTSIMEFSKTELKITSNLGCTDVQPPVPNSGFNAFLEGLGKDRTQPNLEHGCSQ